MPCQNPDGAPAAAATNAATLPIGSVAQTQTIARGIARSETRCAIAFTRLHHSSDCAAPLANQIARIAAGEGANGTARLQSAEPASARPNDQNGSKKWARMPLASWPQA